MTGLVPDLGVARGGLPAPPRTSLVGRGAEVDAVVQALAAGRLVTLTGPGGVGKTRLASAVLTGARALAPDGAWWVQLASLQDPALVGQNLAVAVGTERKEVAAVVERLRPAEGLVVLDNCEHLIAACAQVVDELLDSCPHMRVLATSREPLGVVGETIRPVPPLALAAPADGTPSPAAQLFAERARAVVPDVDLADAEVVAALCRRLGGLPLAIELAAARIRVLSPRQILAGLDDVFRLLVGGPRTAPERQRTLRATLDWGHQLLPGAERTVFRRIAVFPGGFDLRAAEAVAGCGGDVPREDVLELVSALVDRSLVSVDRGGTAVRYRLLPPVREYGREQLAAAGEAEATGAAHLAHFLAMAEELEPQLWGPDQVAALDRLEAEANNLRAALRFARDGGRAEQGARVAVALWRLCALRGHYREGRDWLDWAAGALGDEPTALRADALRGGGGLAFLGCDYPAAVRRLGAALQIYRDLGDGPRAATVLQLLGGVAREQGRYARAEALHAEALTLFTEAGDGLRAAQARGYLGYLAWLQRDWPRAVEQCTAALAAFRELGDAEGIACSLTSLGTTAQFAGDVDRAEALLGEALELAERARLPGEIAWALHQRGRLALRRGSGTAADPLRESAAAHRRLGDLWGPRACWPTWPPPNSRPGRPSGRPCCSAPRRGSAPTSAPISPPASGTSTTGRPRGPGDAGSRRLRRRVGAWPRPPLDDVLADERPGHGSRHLPTGRARGQDGRRRRRAAVRSRAAGDGARRRRRPAGRPDPRDGGLGLRQAPGAVLPAGHLLRADQGADRRRPVAGAVRREPAQRVPHGTAGSAPRARRRRLDRVHRRPVPARPVARALVRPGGVREIPRRRPARPSSTETLSHLQWAIGHYGGELLPELHADWVLERRTHLARAFQGALAAAAQLLGNAGRWAEAVELQRRALTAEPLSEAAARSLMHGLVRAGEPGEAVRVYRRLAERLRDELETAPAAQTRALYEQLVREPSRRTG